MTRKRDLMATMTKDEMADRIIELEQRQQAPVSVIVNAQITDAHLDEITRHVAERLTEAFEESARVYRGVA